MPVRRPEVYGAAPSQRSKKAQAAFADRTEATVGPT